MRVGGERTPALGRRRQFTAPVGTGHSWLWVGVVASAFVLKATGFGNTPEKQGHLPSPQCSALRSLKSILRTGTNNSVFFSAAPRGFLLTQ